MNIRVYTSFFLLFVILFIPSCTPQQNNLDTAVTPIVENNNNGELEETNQNDRISQNEQMTLLLENYDLKKQTADLSKKNQEKTTELFYELNSWRNTLNDKKRN